MYTTKGKENTMFFNKNNFSSITINGKKISCSGNNVVISNGKIVVDGKVISSEIGNNVIVVVDGNVNKLECVGSVEVRGDASYVDCGGSCTVSGEVKGSVNAGGSVKCGTVEGDICAGGSVSCKK